MHKEKERYNYMGKWMNLEKAFCCCSDSFLTGGMQFDMIIVQTGLNGPHRYSLAQLAQYYQIKDQRGSEE